MSDSITIKNPITIVLAFDAKNCNPNGDPDNDNAPRQFEDGIGYLSTECIKYKIRSFIRDKVFFGELDEACTAAPTHSPSSPASEIA